MTGVFSEKHKAAEAALLGKRGIERKEPRKINGAAAGVAPLDMLELKKHIASSVHTAKVDLEDQLKLLVEDALESVRRTEIVVKLPNEVERKLEGRHHYMFPTLVRAAALREPIMLAGPTGSGKSTACKKLADLLGLPFSYTGQTNMPHKVEGSRDPLDHKFYRHTAYTTTFIHGGVHVLEEMDAWNPNASLVVNAPLANKWLTLENGEQYEQHPDAIFIACANTWGQGATAEYVGRNKLDAAFLDRFGIRMMWGYDTQLEIAACGSEEVAKAVQMARYNAERYGIKIVISPRSSITIVKLMKAGFSMEEAFNLNFLASVDENTKHKLLEDVDFT